MLCLAMFLGNSNGTVNQQSLCRDPLANVNGVSAVGGLLRSSECDGTVILTGICTFLQMDGTQVLALVIPVVGYVPWNSNGTVYRLTQMRLVQVARRMNTWQGCRRPDGVDTTSGLTDCNVVGYVPW